MHMSPTYRLMIATVLGLACIKLGADALYNRIKTSPDYQPATMAIPQSLSAKSDGKSIPLLQAEASRPDAEAMPSQATTTAKPDFDSQIANRIFESSDNKVSQKKDPDGKVAAPAVDYFSKLKEVTKLSGIADNGAFINDKFTPWGALTDYAYPASAADAANSNPRLLTPKLAAVSAHTIVIIEPVSPYRRFTLQLNDAARH